MLSFSVYFLRGGHAITPIKHFFYETFFFVTDEYARPYNGLQLFPYADIRIVFAVFFHFVE